jgi:hypothetical protein
MRLAAVALLLLPLSVATPGHGAGLADHPPAARRAAACMVGVLETVPGVSSPRTAVTKFPPITEARSRSGVFDSRPDELLVEYGWRGSTATFLAREDDTAPAHVSFWVTLSGLFTPGKSPDDMGTGKIAPLWKSQCGVNTVVHFE